MTVFVALLRAINVGGAGKLVMSELRSMCEEHGFDDVRTYIQSGNVLFKSTMTKAKVKLLLERALLEKIGKPVGVFLFRRPELAALLVQNPFRSAAPSRVLLLFLSHAPAKQALAKLVIPGREQLQLIGKVLFIHYPDGQGRSKLKMPFANDATGRNLNTVTKLAAMAAELEARD